EVGAAKDPDNDHDTDTIAFLCSLDGAAYKSCTSPKAYSKLADGPHTFKVEAQQEGAGTSAPSSFSWAVSTKPPTIALTSPANSGLYDAATWKPGCSPSGFCGSATDPAGVGQVQVSLRRLSGGSYWTGSSFSTSSQMFVSATLGSPGGSSTTWRYGFSASSFPADGSYTLNVRASDPLGHQTAP